MNKETDHKPYCPPWCGIVFAGPEGGSLLAGSCGGLDEGAGEGCENGTGDDDIIDLPAKCNKLPSGYDPWSVWEEDDE